MADRKKHKKKEKYGQKLEEDKKTYYYNLKLFVAGNEANSIIAKETLKDIYEKHLQGNCKMEIIDILKDYKIALENKILFAPTLFIETPDFQTKIVGSIDDKEKLLNILSISKTKGSK